MTEMIRLFMRVTILLLIFPCAMAAAPGQSGRNQFPTSAPQKAQEHFLLGVYYLHNFAWKQSREEFLQAQKIYPDYAMAYWGESLTYNHPLQPSQDSVSPGRALEKLDPESSKRLAMAPSALEKGFLRAAEAYAFSSSSTADRNLAYLQAMESLYDEFPQHTEVRAFYALALLAVATQNDGEDNARLRQQAGDIATALLAENSQHPGAIHYQIQAYDNPLSAGKAIDAAIAYVQAAPSLPQARHMPSHVYAHLGRWFEVADLNETAYYNAKALWSPGDDVMDQNHAMEFGQYADLQLANYDAALQWIERAVDTLTQNSNDVYTALILGRLKARFIIESKRWQTGLLDETKTSDEIFALGLSAVNMRDFSMAREFNQALKERLLEETENIQLQILQMELEASLLFATGETEASLNLVNEAIELSATAKALDPLPIELKPVYELKGEILLRAGMAEDAIDAFHMSLKTTPFRPWSELGLARSYASIGKSLEASNYYRRLLRSWDDDTLLGVSEAKTHLTLYPLTEIQDN